MVKPRYDGVHTEKITAPKNKEKITRAPDGTPIGRYDGDDDYYITHSPKNFRMFK